MVTKKRKHWGFINRSPVVSFTILTMVLGTGWIYLVVLGALPVELALSSVLSVSIAGIIMTGLLEGKAGLILLLRRVLIWRVGLGYWLWAVFFIVPVFLVGSSFNPVFNGDPISFDSLKPTFRLFPMLMVFVMGVGFGQELGWSGFLMPRLQARYSALRSCLIRTVLVAVWHLPLLFYSMRHPYAFPDFPYGPWIAQQGFLVAFGVMVFMLMLPWSIFYTWIFNNTRGSLLLVAVLHGSEIWTVYWMARTGIGPEDINNYWGYGLVLVLVAITLTVIYGPRNLSRKHKRVMDQPLS
jgi:membrane protease YdiL (CAAX protease family)